MVDQGDVLDADQAAQYLGIHAETLRRLARESRVPAYKVGGGWRFNRSTLYRWAESQHAAYRRRSILVVDDDPTVCDVFRRTLEGAGYFVTTAASGREALEDLERVSRDLVLLDLKMPGMGGPAALREIRKRHGSLPVIIVTGYPESDLMVEAMRYSPIMLLAKPVEPDRILEAVRMAFTGTAGEVGPVP
ncbi:MAG: response regulator [Planctomycetota bacterium]